MGKAKYFSLLVLLISSFICLILLMSGLDTLLFVKQLYFIMFMLIIAGIGLFAMRSRTRLSCLLLSVLFGAFVLDIVYVMLSRSSGIFGWLVFLAGLVVMGSGFFMSISCIGHGCYVKGMAPCRPAKKIRKHAPKIIIEDYSGGRKEQKKDAKAVPKAPAKKRGPSAKKKTSKKAAAGAKPTKKKSARKNKV